MLFKKKRKKICKLMKKHYLCIRKFKISGNSSVGRAQPCQGWGREFESRFPLFFFAQVAEW